MRSSCCDSFVHQVLDGVAALLVLADANGCDNTAFLLALGCGVVLHKARECGEMFGHIVLLVVGSVMILRSIATLKRYVHSWLFYCNHSTVFDAVSADKLYYIEGEVCLTLANLI